MANQQTTSAVFSNLVREAESFARNTGAGIEALAGEIIKLNVMYKGAIGQDHPLARPLLDQMLKPTARQTPQATKSTTAATATKAPSTAKGKRVRRRPGELIKLGTSMVAFIKEGGKEGQLASAIRAKFPDIGP